MTTRLLNSTFLSFPPKVFDSRKATYLLLFLTAVTLRGIPEILVQPYPVGFETITYYAPVIASFPGKTWVDVFSETFRYGPLFYVLMWFASVATGAHSFALLKIAGPVLYGGLIISFCAFLKRGLNFEYKMAFLGTLILMFQIAALRESLDRCRTVLALTFFFTTLVALKGKHKLWWLLVTVLSVLTVLSRDYVAAVLFVAVLAFAVLDKKDRHVILFAMLPAIAIFALTVYPPTNLPQNYASNGFENYSWAVVDAFSIFAICYLPLLPFILRGFYRDKLIDPIVGWLCIGSFSVAVIPWFAVPGYQRWLMLLAFPFSIYAVKGFQHFHLLRKHARIKLIAIVMVLVTIGFGYSTATFSYVGIIPNSYVPVNLIKSSIPWNQVDDVIECLNWLDGYAGKNSSILAKERFYGWTALYLDRAKDDISVFLYSATDPSPLLVLQTALHEGFNEVYLIWYTQQNPDGFIAIHSSNDISIFQYT